MQTILLIIELIVAAALVGVILLQRSEGGALGMGGGGSGGGLFSPRGAADTLTRTTAILGALFFAACIGLNLLSLHAPAQKSILESQTPAPASAPAVPAKPAKPAVPIGQ
jgi:preprotein translocase subunit SecG